MHTIYFKYIWLLALLPVFSCKKLIGIPPPTTEISSENVFTTDATAAAALTGIYTEMSQGEQGGTSVGGLSIYPSLSADELTLYDASNLSYSFTYTNDLSSQTVPGADFWESLYGLVYMANAAIEGISVSNSLTPEIRQQLLGEAYFVRAYCYFNLVNLFGDVPMVTGTDYKLNAVLTQSPAAEVWQQVIADLVKAKRLLNVQFVGADAQTVTGERTRPTYWVAAALLARTYLYTKDWNDASLEADTVIGNSALFGLDSLPDVFLMNSTETIWALQPVSNYPTANTGAGAIFVLPSTGPSGLGQNPFYLSKFVLKAFEPLDQRMTNWVDSVVVGGIAYYFPFK
jgi:hypothetical protein